MTPDPLEMPDTEEEVLLDATKLLEFRAQCAAEWMDKAEEGWTTGMLRGGPLDSMAAPRNVGVSEWTGAWANDEGEPILVTYEWVKDEEDDRWFGEYAGTRKVADIASETMESFFAGERGAPEEELEPVDLDSMSTEDALAFLREDNARRVAELFELSGGSLDVEHSSELDVGFLKIFVRRILTVMSTKMLTGAELEYENFRSQFFDELEDKFNKFQDERDAAMAQARLSLQGPPPGMPGMVPGGPAPERVTFPPRRIRRGQ